MKRIGELYRGEQLDISIEIFPPRTEKGDARLTATLERLSEYQPAFISCTYGAGGSTRDRTLDWCEAIQTSFATPATAHLTCVNATRDDLTAWLADAAERGIGNIMALRGDPPEGETSFSATAGGFSNANELVGMIRETHPDFGIGVAGYPEKHPEATSLDDDIRFLKQKVDAGAHAVFTQLFYDNDLFFQFRDQAIAAGVDVPIVPGLMPITEFDRIQRITSLCGARIPKSLFAQLEASRDDLAAQQAVGIEFAIEQCEALKNAGVPGFHFYVLNKSAACEAILDELELDD